MIGTTGMHVWSLAIKTNNVFAGTYGGGVWKRLLSDFVSFNVSTNNLNIEALENSTNSFNIISNTAWSITVPESWLTVNNSSGIGNASITLTASGNPATLPRSANVTVSSIGLESKIILVTQDGLTTGINESGDLELKIYPIPANHILYFEGLINNSIISVFDINGTLLFEKQLNDNKLDISLLKKGIYFIKVINNKQISINKFIKS